MASPELLILQDRMMSGGYPGFELENINFVKSLLTKENRKRVLAWLCSALTGAEFSPTNKYFELKVHKTLSQFYPPKSKDLFQETTTRLIEILNRAFLYLIKLQKDSNFETILDLSGVNIVPETSILPLHIKPQPSSKTMDDVVKELETKNQELEKEIKEMEPLGDIKSPYKVNFQMDLKDLNNICEETSKKLNKLDKREGFEENDETRAQILSVEAQIGDVEKLFSKILSVIGNIPLQQSDGPRLEENSEFDVLINKMKDTLK